MVLLYFVSIISDGKAIYPCLRYQCGRLVLIHLDLSEPFADIPVGIIFDDDACNKLFSKPKDAWILVTLLNNVCKSSFVPSQNGSLAQVLLWSGYMRAATKPVLASVSATAGETQDLSVFRSHP